jgi:nucleotide-binding universal stress UspA family protein
VTAVTSRPERPTERMAQPASGPVTVAGSQAAPEAARTLLLATDLSEASSSATEEAFELGALLHASLLIVSVIDPGSLQLPGGRFRARIDQVRAAREQQAQALVERGREAGLEVSFLVWTGDPGSMIVEAAEAERADMILVGSHGRGAVGRFFLGSVSEHVVRHAPCPVLVVRPREQAPFG